MNAEPHVDLSQAFAELHVGLETLEKRLNPEAENLHFCPRLPDLAQTDFTDMLALAEDGLSKVREHNSHFLQARLYADGMFWYRLLLLISTASLQSRQSPEVPEPTLHRLVEILVDISHYSLIAGPSDIARRNHEALGNILYGFPSPPLRVLARNCATRSPQMAEFVAFTIKAAENAEQPRPAATPAAN